MTRSRVVLASNNTGKLEELQSLLGGRFELVTQHQLGVAQADENGLTFVENAIIKARNACRQTGLAAIADDSGLAVDWLGGLPGVHSSRYAGKSALDADNNRKLLLALAGIPEAQRGARFHCVVVMMRSDTDPTPAICQGSWAGWILQSPRGANGFGYDPLFYLPHLGLTAAELTPEEKNRMSHRGQALQALLKLLR